MLHTTESKADRYFSTLHVPCVICGLTWHKHPMWCPLWKSLAPLRCAVDHAWINRSSQTVEGARVHEYECNLCSIPSVWSQCGMIYEPHPWCAEGIHYWNVRNCSSGCCFDGNEYCTCGAKRKVTSEAERFDLRNGEEHGYSCDLNLDAEGADTQNSDTRFP